jgi:hypothetical protein
MGFKTKEQLADIITGGAYKCGPHDFVCDLEDLETIRKHEDELPHFIDGTGLCQRCKAVTVSFKNLPKPPRNKETGLETEPGCFCDPCKEQLRKELGIVA